MFPSFQKTPRDLKGFLKIVKASRLISESELEVQFQRFTENQQDLSVFRFADFLVSQKLLTEWQSDKLLDGKFKGFYIDHYLLESHDHYDEDYSYFIAKNVNTNEKSLMAVVPNSRTPVNDTSVHYHILPLDKSSHG